MNFISYVLLVSLGINVVMFVPAFIYKTDKITDISYAVTFAVVATYGYLKSTQEPLHLLILFLVLLWSVRIGTFLFLRVLRNKKDARFDGMRENFWLFLRFWFLQGLTVFVVLLAATLAFTQKQTNITAYSLLGVVVFLAGLLLEATADAQKSRFSANPANKGKWIDIGVWSISRHPNYLGEMMVWVGMYWLVISSVTVDNLALGWAALSPLYIIGLLLFGSGVPILEKSADKKWGNDPAYKKYKSQVPVLIPTFTSIRRYK